MLDYTALSANQVFAGHREIATLLRTPRWPWTSDQPCRTAERLTGSPHAVCRTGSQGVARLGGVPSAPEPSLA
jgi:hypothetical protein